MGIVRGNPQMMELHLRLRPSERGRALVRHRVMMLVREVEHGLACRRRHRPERQSYRVATWDTHALAQAENRIEDRARGVGQRPTVMRRGGRSNGPPAPEKARAI